MCLNAHCRVKMCTDIICEIEYYEKTSTHAQIGLQEAEKQLKVKLMWVDGMKPNTDCQLQPAGVSAVARLSAHALINTAGSNHSHSQLTHQLSLALDERGRKRREEWVKYLVFSYRMSYVGSMTEFKVKWEVCRQPLFDLLSFYNLVNKHSS